MTGSNELEQKILEFENMPGRMLGLSGWFLRSLPKEARRSFLKNYGRDITLAFHPDKTINPAEKEKREKYIQAVSEDIAYLTGDAYAFELAIEDIPSERNPVVKLRTSLEESQREIDRLEGTLSDQRETNKRLMVAGQNYEERIEAMTKLLNEMKRQSCFIKLRSYQNWMENNLKCIPISTGQNIVLFGRKMSIKRTVSNAEGTKTLREVCLFDLAHDEFDRFEISHRDFSKNVERDLLSNEDKSLMFENSKTMTKEGRVTLLGSLPYLSIRSYLDFYHKNVTLKGIKSVAEREMTFGRLYNHLLYIGETDNVAQIKYERNIIPFTMPFAAPGVPALLKHEYLYRRIKNRTRYSLFYVQDAEAIPSGTSVDLWFTNK